MKKIAQEPLFHFLLLGGLIFILYSFLNQNQNSVDDETIYINDDDISRLAQMHLRNWNEEPGEDVLKRLLNDEIEAEIMYREALKLNLDHNDEIIRRRLKQKYSFLVKDLVDASEVSKEDALNFYKENEDQFLKPKQISFQQIYFNPDIRPNAFKDAERELSQIQRTIPRGDGGHLPSDIDSQNKTQIRKLFGEEFAQSLFQLETGKWMGPIASGYGYHLVNIDSIVESEPYLFDEIEGQIITQLKDEQLKTFNKNTLDELKRQYSVKYELNKWEHLISK